MRTKELFTFEDENSFLIKRFENEWVLGCVIPRPDRLPLTMAQLCRKPLLLLIRIGSRWRLDL